MGRLGRPHGLNGYVGIYIDDADLGRVQAGSTVFLDGVEHAVRSVRPAKKGYRIAFAGIVDQNGAEGLRGAEVTVTQRRALDADEYWPSDLEGLTVVSDNGSVLGVVEAVVVGSAQDRLVVRTPRAVFEVPFVGALVPIVDLDGRRIVVSDIPGLLSD